MFDFYKDTEGKKKDVAPERLYHKQSQFSKKVMVSCGVSWQGVVTRPFFLDTNKTKVNAWNNQVVMCDCGTPSTNHHIVRHKKRNVHAKRILFGFMKSGLGRQVFLDAVAAV